MILRSCVVFVFALCLAGTLAVSSAHAQARVGEAVLVQNEVLRVSAASTAQINVGDGLLRDEIVRTGADSATRLVMADSTNLSLGPNAAIKLDRTVFDDEHTYRDIAVRLTTGAFRFVTGHSEKTAYKITTPLATIGVRGTVLDILSQRGRTIVVLQEGASQRLHARLPMRPAHAARRHRDHHLIRRQDHDPEDQPFALDLCRDLRGIGRALHRQRLRGRVPHHHPAGR